MKKVAILTGAGISAESGLKTFRSDDGLWRNYSVAEVANIKAWKENPQLVLDFYNERRNNLKNVEPNAAHYGLVELEKCYDIQIITQNVDNLHERAGSSKILKMHGDLTKCCEENNKEITYEYYNDLKMGDVGPNGIQLRPFIVWFGEAVENIFTAVNIIKNSDILVIIGTTLVVQPVASLVNFAKKIIYLNKRADTDLENIIKIIEPATAGAEKLKDILDKELK